MADNRPGWGNPWLERVVGLIDSYEGPVGILGPADIGYRQVATALDSADRPLVWVDLRGVADTGSIDAGARLADAVKHVTRAQLIPYGLAFPPSVDVLDRYVDILGPFAFVVAGMETQPEAWGILARLNRGGSRVVLCATSCPEGADLEGFRMLDEGCLRLTLDEAVMISQGQLLPSDLESVLAESGGMFEAFARRVSESKGLPKLTPVVTEEDLSDLLATNEVDLAEFVWALYRRRRYIEAMQLACSRAPEVVPSIVEECGEAYSQRGMFERLFSLLSRLPDDVVWSESVLRWKFLAAISLNRHAEVSATIEHYLEEHEAPELRAQYAAARPSSDFLEQTTRAVSAKRTPVTLRHHAFALSLAGRVDDSLETSRRALRLADVLGQYQLVVAIATDISTSLVRTGELVDALWWAEWACSQYFELGLNERLRRLSAVAALVYPKILVGDEVRLSDLVAELDVSADSLGVPSYEGVVSTAADYQSVFGDLGSALDLYRANFEASSYEQAGSASVDFVRCLCDLERVDEAVDVGRRVVALGRGASGFEQACAWLSAGIALRSSGVPEALGYLSNAKAAFANGFDAVRDAQTSIQLGLWHMGLGDTEAARRAVRDGHAVLSQLGASGWQLLGGVSPMVGELRQLLETRPVSLEIEVLGTPSVVLGSNRVAVRGRSLEILTALATFPEGIGGEPLASRLYGDRVVMNTFKAAVARLRDIVPLESRPYRIAVPYRADFLELLEYLKHGQIRQALSLYRGPMLPGSVAPAIGEIRAHVDEALRQAVLQSGDVEAMLELMRRTDEDDLELLETAYQLIPRNDPQSALLHARIRQLRRDWESSES